MLGPTWNLPTSQWHHHVDSSWVSYSAPSWILHIIWMGRTHFVCLDLVLFFVICQGRRESYHSSSCECITISLEIICIYVPQPSEMKQRVWNVHFVFIKSSNFWYWHPPFCPKTKISQLSKVCCRFIVFNRHYCTSESLVTLMDPGIAHDSPPPNHYHHVSCQSAAQRTAPRTAGVFFLGCCAGRRKQHGVGRGFFLAFTQGVKRLLKK